MVFHCLSVPYSSTRKDLSLCAFVQKVYKFCDEMTKRRYTFIIMATKTLWLTVQNILMLLIMIY